MLEGILYVVDQEVSCLERILKVFARKTENFAELINGVFRVVRMILQTSERKKVEIAMREPMKQFEQFGQSMRAPLGSRGLYQVRLRVGE